MDKLIFNSVCISAGLLVGSSLYAQEIPRQIRELMADKIGIPADAPDYNQRLEALSKRPITDEMKRMGFAKSFGVSPEEIDLNEIFKQPSDKAVVSLVPQTIASRSSFAEGVALEKSVDEKRGSVFSIKEKDLTSEIALINAHGRDTVKRFIETKRIPECTESKVVRDEAPPGERDLDILVLAGKTPLDADQIYGGSTRVIEYKVGTPNEADSILVSLAQPECLPYRVRVLGGRRHIYYGEKALLNFDRDPTGPGEKAIKVKPERSKKR